LTVIVSVLAAFALTRLPASGDARQVPKDGVTFMQLKLEDAQRVLNGIAVRDFEMIETSAGALVRLSKKAEFQLLDTPEYLRHSDAFRRTAETLGQMARAKNLDGAALAYVALTMNCVACHKHVRDARRT
jgi:hypothetical protein